MAAEPGPGRRGDAYLRKSPGSSASKTEISLELQLDDIKARMEADGVTLGMIHEDVHPRWELWERPALSALRERIKDGLVDVVYAWDTSRLATGIEHQAILLEEGDRFGCSYRFVTEQVDRTTPLGKAVWLMTSTFNEIERERIRDRTQGGKRKHLERGKMLFYAKPNYGYRWANAAHTCWVVDADEADVVRAVFRDVVGGATLSDVALRLTGAGVPPPGRAQTWQTSTLAEWLHNPAYKGAPAVYRTERVRRDGRWIRLRRDPEHWLALNPNSVPALVDPEDWALAQLALTRHRTQAPRGMAPDRQTEFLLRGGLATCAHCGRPLHALTVPRKRDYAPEKVIYRTYACASVSRKRAQKVAGADDGFPACPSPVRVRAEALDLAVWRGVLEHLQSPPPADGGAAEAARAQREHADAARAVRAAERVMANTATELVLAETDEERETLRGLQRTQAAVLRAARGRHEKAVRDLAAVAQAREQALALFVAFTERGRDLEGLIPGRVGLVQYQTMRAILGTSGVGVVVWHKDAPAGPPDRGAGRYAVRPYEAVPWPTVSGSSCGPGSSTPHYPDPDRLARLVRALAG